MVVPEPARWRVWFGSNWGRRRLRAWAGQRSESHRWKRMTEDGVRAADTPQTQSPDRSFERGACQRAPLYRLSSSSIGGLSLFLFERVTLFELVGRQSVSQTLPPRLGVSVRAIFSRLPCPRCGRFFRPKNSPRDQFVALFGRFVAFFAIFIGKGLGGGLPRHRSFRTPVPTMTGPREGRHAPPLPQIQPTK